MLACAAGDDSDNVVTIGRIAVGKLLISTFPANIGIRDKKGMDAFAHACCNGTNALIQVLLASPLEEDAEPLLARRDLAQNTPLHHASAFGKLKTLRILVDAGADARARNHEMWTPLDYSASVSAEVYFRGLVRDRDASIKSQQQQQQQQRDQQHHYVQAQQRQQQSPTSVQHHQFQIPPPPPPKSPQYQPQQPQQPQMQQGPYQYYRQPEPQQQLFEGPYHHQRQAEQYASAQEDRRRVRPPGVRLVESDSADDDSDDELVSPTATRRPGA